MLKGCRPDSLQRVQERGLHIRMYLMHSRPQLLAEEVLEGVSVQRKVTLSVSVYPRLLSGQSFCQEVGGVLLEMILENHRLKDNIFYLHQWYPLPGYRTKDKQTQTVRFNFLRSCIAGGGNQGAAEGGCRASLNVATSLAVIF